MISVTKKLMTETAHRLCRYQGKCAHIHGHSYVWEVTASLAGKGTQANGISIDFSYLKQALRQVIYDRFDHALVLWAHEDPLWEARNRRCLRSSDGANQKVVWTDYNPTAEEFAGDVAALLQRWFNDNSHPEADEPIEIDRVRVWETADSYGEWKSSIHNAYVVSE